MPTEASMDHLKLASDPYYMAENRRAIQNSKGAVLLQVRHEDSGSCCRREPWETTLLRLLSPVP